ncbi:MAG: bifunctional alpha,alpha-trehalose-phosphate synthase (UDP-forming)/trehalose-phosphatase [Myxococcales bacterium]|nr:bifunctional alpha,alpha-trehalose-phosphate synthase (UDP-forming)/trehalose-phosphatase [Myxococcales bacterium]
MAKNRLIVASVRLPVTMTRGEQGWQVAHSTGGLVTALSSVLERQKFTWLGWPGAYVDEADRRTVTRELAKHGTSPVFIEQEHMDPFYQGFSNEVLWPLFHNLMERARFDRNNWRSYRTVNQMYADAIAKIARPGDVIWIHDYQLCLVPQLLRAKGLGCPIGFFLHIPFPSAETYRTLPVAEDLLRGLLGADLLGFHAYEYVSNLRMAALRVLGIESEPAALRLQSREVQLEVMPIGIDPGEIAEMLRTAEARKELTELERNYAGKRIIVGVDRLDYTKGIPQKLEAYEEFLHNHPEWRESTVLIQVAAPSRTGVEEYQNLKRSVDELVGRINGQYSTPNHTPVVYINQSVSRDKLAVLYRAADVALVTPIRDGMNLVGLEYVAARGQRGGTLILSEFTGAAHCMPGARLVNPFNTSQVATVLGDALENEGPNFETFAHMSRFVNENTSLFWAKRFLTRLEHLSGDPHHEAKLLRINEEPVLGLVKNARSPLVFLDYDGTLRSYVINPKEAVPDARILNVLQRLAEYATVYVVSGRDRRTLEDWLGGLPIGLVCEHGLSIKPPGGEWQDRTNVSGSALARFVRPLLEDFSRRTPGSAIEMKQAAIAWHYRGADPEYGSFQAKELLTRLEDLLKRRPYRVLRGNRVIEVRHEHVTKGSAVGHLLDRHPDADFLFCAGDDRTDEEMMNAIPKAWRPRAVTCWVGSRNVTADYWRESDASLLGELEAMIRIWRRGSAQPPAAGKGGRKKATASGPARAKKRTSTTQATASGRAPRSAPGPQRRAKKTP